MHPGYPSITARWPGQAGRRRAPQGVPVEAAEIHLGIAILAAGRARRMGAPKMLLPWGGTTVLGHQVDVWLGLGAATVGVVHAVDDLPVVREIARHSGVMAIPNSDPDGAGMWGSIRCAVSWPGWPAGLTHFGLALGDQPHLRPSTLADLLSFARRFSCSICQLSYQGVPQHPIVFPLAWWARLASHAGPTLNDFLIAHHADCSWRELPEPSLRLDLDTPADYTSLYGSSSFLSAGR
jgi:molybdenum cofactor cytidylyltransferase